MSAVADTERADLIGLDDLRANHSKPVLVCADANAYEAAKTLSSDVYVCCTWLGGKNGWQNFNWDVLAGRSLLIWCQEWELSIFLACQCEGVTKIINSARRPEEFIESGWSEFVAWARAEALPVENDMALGLWEKWQACGGMDAYNLIQDRLKAGLDPIEQDGPPDPDPPPLLTIVGGTDVDLDSISGIPAPGKSKEEELLPFVWAKDVSDSEDGLHEILEDVLTAGAMSVWYGDSSCGKTYLVLALAAAIAKGVPWLGKRTVQGCVIYVAAEGNKTIERRIRAIRIADGELQDFPLGIVKTCINMCASGADTLLLAELVLARAKEIGQTPTLVVIDTLSSVLAGGNENDSTDMGALVMNGAVLQEMTGAHVLWVHHTGKDAARGARGHSLLRAKTDTEVEISHDRETGLRTAKISKQRDLSSDGMELAAKLLPVDLGIDRWGKPITACVVEPMGAVESPKGSAARAGKPLRGASARAWQIAQELAADGAMTIQTSATPPGKRIIPLEAWRTAFRDTCAGKTDGAFRMAWARVLDTLQDAGRIGVYRETIWIW